MLFDRATATVTELAPAPDTVRLGVAIGGNTVAFMDYGLTADSSAELMVLNLSTPAAPPLRMTNDLVADANPAVSPDGNVVVWERCVLASNCDIYAARRSGSSWSIEQVSSSALTDTEPDTSGTQAVFQRGTAATNDLDVVVGSLTGGAEQIIELAGLEQHATIRQAIVAFERRVPSALNSDIYLVDLSTKQLYQITNTPDSNETLNDVTVLPGGEVRLVWSGTKPMTTDEDIFGATFVLPASNPPDGGTGGGGGTTCGGTVTLEASRSYCPTRWTDGHANLSFPVTIPASLPVTAGGSGGKKATLTFETADGRLVCWYRGTQASSYTFERCQLESRGGGTCGGGHGHNRNYGHGHNGGGRDDDDDDDGDDDDDDDRGHGHGGSGNGNNGRVYVAGSTVDASSVTLHIEGGNHSATTRVSVTLHEACGTSTHPLDAAGAPDARDGANVGCSSAGDALVPMLMLATLLLLVRRRPAEVRLVARARRSR
jgi:MYXO-CTERM domain-containing protein